MNYFELFDLPISLEIDKALLTRKFIELQKKYHPDFYTQESEAEQQEALETSAELNKAIKVLQNPDARLEYLLQLKGIVVTDEKFNLPPDFLMEVMELNENLENDTTQAVSEFEASIYQQVAPLIAAFNYDTATPDQLEQLKTFYYKKKYLQRILDRKDR